MQELPALQSRIIPYQWLLHGRAHFFLIRGDIDSLRHGGGGGGGGVAPSCRAAPAAPSSPAVKPASTEYVARRPQYKALLLDVGGTLLDPARPVHATYAEIGAKYGVKATPSEIKEGLKRVFAQPPGGAQRYEGDGRKFWRHVVELVTGCNDQVYFEELYEYYAQAKAWTVAAGARDSLTLLRDAGVKIAVVSNFDSRLRPLLRELQVYDLFHAVIVSAEVGFDKPSTEMFRIALDELAVAAPELAVHVGDDPVADYQGALEAGLDAWLWQKDVMTFRDIADRILPPPAGASP
eukprot:SM000085S23278  [mRNA]  locus=s85:498523:501181:+ [translate_table: standard]